MKNKLNFKEPVYIDSDGGKIYLELGYPAKTPAPAILITHGLRSYFPGFLDIFAKKLRHDGFITAKLHFIGTGKSSGLFEDKTTEAMLKNYVIAVEYLKKLPQVTTIGFIGRSNAGALPVIKGPDKRIKAYVMLATAAYYSMPFKNLFKKSEKRGNFFYDKSFKRYHTKGEGRLPTDFIEKAKKYDNRVLSGIKHLKNVMYIQCLEDEAVLVSEKHFEYWNANLSNPHKMIMLPKGSHSYKGCKSNVIKESVGWFKKYLQI